MQKEESLDKKYETLEKKEAQLASKIADNEKVCLLYTSRCV